MKVKDFMFWAMMLLIVSLCACSDDDNEVPAEEKLVATSLMLDINFELYEDVFTVADVYLGYIDANGEQVSEKLSSPKFSKEVVIPLSKAKSVGYCIILQSKKLETHEAVSYRMGLSANQGICVVLDQYEKSMRQSSSMGSIMKMSVGADDIEEFLERSVVLVDYGCKLSSDDKLENAQIEWGFDFI